ncbi:hypothetical protein D1AOALGA4SA_8764 [Olavius algarvensis Delta 1 endosymbiont]|nr:hypothetical protein D1AOALGA4SA_8764 [Olavius algarvensis Delta 1 endosymbiont]
MISSQRGGVYHRIPTEQWNGGRMEYWEYKADGGLILQTDPCHFYKDRSHSTKPNIPAFQYSIIPLPFAADSRHSRLALT